MGGEVEATRKDEVDRAVAAARRAVGRLVALLGKEDPAVVEKATAALEGIGDFAVGPLAVALPRAHQPRHRIAIVVLTRFASQARGEVLTVLDAARMREDDPGVRAVLAAARMNLVCDWIVEMLKAQRK